jgi:hypothetical protein
MEKATICLIVSNQPDVVMTDNAITIPRTKREELISKIAKALDEEDDIIIDDIEGDTIIIPFNMLYYAKRIQFTDIEREEE